MADRKYPEAFALLVYEGPDGQCETVWNSRDGIAPWQIATRDGEDSMSVRDELAGVDPNYVPKPGERVIVDADPEERRNEEIARVTANWADYAPSFKMLQGIRSLDEAIKRIRKKSYAGAPRIVVVAGSGWPNIEE